MTSIKDKVIFLASMSIIFTAIIFLVTAAAFAFMPVKVIEAQVQPYRVLTQQIEAGDTMVYEVNACKYKNLQSTVIRRFVDEDGLRIALTPEQNNVKPGCNKTRIPIATPENLHPGRWHLTLDISYRVNLLRTESYHFITDSFTVK